MHVDDGHLTFSEREKDIMALACQGMTDKEIASTLRLSISTVHEHWERMRGQSGAKSRLHLYHLWLTDGKRFK